MTDSPNDKKISEAQENLERIEERIRPYSKATKVKTMPIIGRWQQTPAPVHGDEDTEDNLTKQKFMNILRKVSRPNEPETKE